MQDQVSRGIVAPRRALLSRGVKHGRFTRSRCGRRRGVFIIAVHRAFVLGLGARHRGIVDLSEGVIRCVTVFACYSSSSSSVRIAELVAESLLVHLGSNRSGHRAADLALWHSLVVQMSASPRVIRPRAVRARLLAA